MKLRILWLYHDVKDVFGDEGNIQVLKHRALKRDIDVEVVTCGLNEMQDASEFDLIYMGTNIGYEDCFLLEDIRKKEKTFEEAMKKGSFFFLLSGGFQVFGKNFISSKGAEEKGLGLLPYSTDYKNLSAAVGNICVKHEKLGTIIGFENHNYQMIEVTNPFGKIVKGCGNTYHKDYEGYECENVIATNMHGPLLPKNPLLADYIIKGALKNKYGNIELAPIDDEIENAARNTLLKRWNIA